MRQKFLRVAREIFGERRFEEIQGELWLDYPRLKARLLEYLPAILREWENRFRRDSEEGRVQTGSTRKRVTRFSELDPDGKSGRLDGLVEHIRRKF